MKPNSTVVRKAKLSGLLLISVSFLPVLSFGQAVPPPPAPVPPQARPGECYARVKIPARYQLHNQNVVVEDGHRQYVVEQPKLARRTERVMVKSPSVRYEVVQPRFRTVTEQKLVRPAYEKLTLSPPQFANTMQSIQTSAPRIVWKRGTPALLRARGYTVLSVTQTDRNGSGLNDPQRYQQRGLVSTQNCGTACEIWCLVREPGESVNFNRKTMVHPGGVSRSVVPPKYANIRKQIMVDRGGIREIPVPPRFEDLTMEDVVAPARVREVYVPPKHGTVTGKILISPERYEWQKVTCRPGMAGYQAPTQPAIVAPRPKFTGQSSFQAPIQAPNSAPVRSTPNVYGNSAPIIYGGPLTANTRPYSPAYAPQNFTTNSGNMAIRRDSLGMLNDDLVGGPMSDAETIIYFNPNKPKIAAPGDPIILPGSTVDALNPTYTQTTSVSSQSLAPSSAPSSVLSRSGAKVQIIGSGFARKRTLSNAVKGYESGDK